MATLFQWSNGSLQLAPWGWLAIVLLGGASFILKVRR